MSRSTCRQSVISSTCSILRKTATADRLTETLDRARGVRSGRFFLWGTLPLHKIVIAPQHRRNLVPVPCAATMNAYYHETTLRAAYARYAAVRLHTGRLLAIGANLASGLLAAALVFPFAPSGARLALSQRWARGMIRALGARLCVEGEAAAPGAARRESRLLARYSRDREPRARGLRRQEGSTGLARHRLARRACPGTVSEALQRSLLAASQDPYCSAAARRPQRRDLSGRHHQRWLGRAAVSFRIAAGRGRRCAAGAARRHRLLRRGWQPERRRSVHRRRDTVAVDRRDLPVRAHHSAPCVRRAARAARAKPQGARARGARHDRGHARPASSRHPALETC